MTPRLPPFAPLRIEDRAALEEALGAGQPEVSELSFTSLFIYRNEFRTRWARHGGWLLLLEQRDDGSSYFLPPVGEGDPGPVVLEMLAWLREETGERAPSIERADRRLVERLDPRLPVEPMREHFDYVYRRQALATLAGRHLHGKRTLLRRFREGNGFRFEPLSPGHAAGCRRVLGEWAAARAGRDEDGPADQAAAREALDHLGQLPLAGGVVLVDGRVEAFAVAERLNRTTLVTHVEKASPRDPALFTLICQQLAERCDPGIEWVNRAQDLGLPGLRRAKEAYRPHRLVEKFRIGLPGVHHRASSWRSRAMRPADETSPPGARG